MTEMATMQNPGYFKNPSTVNNNLCFELHNIYTD